VRRFQQNSFFRFGQSSQALLLLVRHQYKIDETIFVLHRLSSKRFQEIFKNQTLALRYGFHSHTVALDFFVAKIIGFGTRWQSRDNHNFDSPISGDYF
jgi:hypothetical protein